MQIAADEQELLRGMKQMVQAIDFVHSKDYLHMDVQVSLQEFVCVVCSAMWQSCICVSDGICLLACVLFPFGLLVWKGLAGRQYLH